MIRAIQFLDFCIYKMPLFICVLKNTWIFNITINIRLFYTGAFVYLFYVTCEIYTRVKCLEQNVN